MHPDVILEICLLILCDTVTQSAGGHNLQPSSGGSGVENGSILTTQAASDWKIAYRKVVSDFCICDRVTGNRSRGGLDSQNPDHI